MIHKKTIKYNHYCNRIAIVNTAVWYTGELLKRGNPKSSHHNEIFFFLFILLFTVSIWEEWCLLNYFGNHLRLYVNQTIMLFAWNLHNDICQLFLNETGKKFKTTKHSWTHYYFNSSTAKYNKYWSCLLWLVGWLG